MNSCAPFASVVVPVYNGATTVSSCIDSICALDFPADRHEIIVVDNQSSDATPEMLRSYEGRITILHEPKRGAAAARNCGIRHAQGSVIAFTDADCIVDRAWLAHITAPLADHRVGIVGGKILSRRPCNAVELFGETIHNHDQAINVFKPPYVISMSWASRKDVLESCGLFDESLLRGQDCDLSYRIHNAGYVLVYEPGAIIYHRNERTLCGLFNEGYVHGFWSVKVGAASRVSIDNRLWLRSRLCAVRKNSGLLYRGPKRFHALCSVIFNCGKILGRYVAVYKHK